MSSLQTVASQVFVHLVGDDHAVVDGAEPAAHDDADAAGVEQAADLFGQRL